MIKANEVSFATATRRRGLSAIVAVSALVAPVGTSAAFANGQGGVTPVAFPAGQPAIPTGVDCVTVRYYVNEHGRAKSIAWAIKNGYSWAQIAEAKRCLRG
ncbi:hypothetical protein DNX69_22780 [Rhodopseudomonas palustris]|uniref:Uncharacterized protein n=1 Tax=Rhodopseudomonas palustris TaxID=1076 RepID=A0A323UPN8_RHOPL|nr:hypothetical protein [Rhodopseudomonas palustris]PZA09598.1 hypothetical protein DNX69_22780 [Rhodopseudomonas palustris]